jgi:hypothetical protein
MRELPQWLRLFCAALPFVSVFLFPWKLTALFMFLAGLVFPPIPAIVGVLSDVVYYPGFGLYEGTLTGILLTILAYAVRYIVRTRIM